MITIMKNALKERIRRKELYIVVAVGILLILLCSSDSTSISMNGEPLVGFRNMFMVMHVLIHVISCLLAVVLSLRTIPKEYERRNSHLVWVRGIGQAEYHAGLAAANVLATAFSAAFLYMVLAGYAVAKGHASYVVRMLPAYLILTVSVSIVSLLVSVLSICLPSMAVGILAVLFAGFGVLHGFLEIFKNAVGGAGSASMSFLLKVIPDLNGLQKQAYNLIIGERVDLHLVWIGLFALWVISSGLFIFKKKEA